jgi:hypothetical protein
MNKNKRIALVSIILTLLAGLISGFNMIGKVASLAQVLIIFFSGFGGGASLVHLIRHKEKTQRKE